MFYYLFVTGYGPPPQPTTGSLQLDAAIQAVLHPLVSSGDQEQDEQEQQAAGEEEEEAAAHHEAGQLEDHEGLGGDGSSNPGTQEDPSQSKKDDDPGNHSSQSTAPSLPVAPPQICTFPDEAFTENDALFADHWQMEAKRKMWQGLTFLMVSIEFDDNKSNLYVYDDRYCMYDVKYKYCATGSTL